MKKLLAAALALCLALAAPAPVAAGLHFHGVASAGSFTPQDIISSIPIWFDANDGSSLTLSGSNVTAWANKGNLGGSAVPGTNASPTQVTSVLNGKNGVSFNGSTQALDTASVTLASANLSIWVVAKRSATGNYDAMLALGYGSGVGAGLGVDFTGAAANDWAGPDGFLAFGNGFGTGQAPRVIMATPSPATDTANFYRQRVELGTAVAYYINGSSQTISGNSVSGTQPAITDQVSVGWSRAGAGSYFHGTIVEIVVGANLTSGDQANIEAYLLAKWGV